MSYSLRPYQRDCLRAIGDQFTRVDSTLAVMATGLGKTVCLASLAKDWKAGGVMVVAHRDELVSQAVRTVEATTGQRPWVEKADKTTEKSDSMFSGSNVIVTSAQSMGQASSKRRDRVFKWAGHKFGGIRLVIVDEAHRFAPGTQYDRVVTELRKSSPNPVKLLGVTATPRRTDERSLGNVFESCAYQYAIGDAIKDGWLVPIRQRAVYVKGLDFSRIKSRRNAGGEIDFSEQELQAILMEEKSLHEMVAATKEHVGDRQGLVFCSGVEHAKAMSTMLRRYIGGDCAEFIHGCTPPADRRRIIERYAAGELKFIANCGVLTEGFDAPATSLIVMARPTKSLLLYTQIIGRGTRPLPGVVDGIESCSARKAAIASSTKPECLVLDFVGNAGRHKLINCIDVLAGTVLSDDERIAACAAAEAGAPVVAAIGMAAVECELAKEMKAFRQHRQKEEQAVATEMHMWRNECKRIGIRADRVDYEAREIDAFDRRDTGDFRPTNQRMIERPFKHQIDLLCSVGWTPERAAKLSRGQAFGICKKIKARLAGGGE